MVNISKGGCNYDRRSKKIIMEQMCVDNRYVSFVNDQPQVPLSDLDGFPSDEEVKEAILRKWRRLGKIK